MVPKDRYSMCLKTGSTARAAIDRHFSETKNEGSQRRASGGYEEFESQGVLRRQ